MNLWTLYPGFQQRNHHKLWISTIKYAITLPIQFVLLQQMPHCIKTVNSGVVGFFCTNLHVSSRVTMHPLIYAHMEEEKDSMREKNQIGAPHCMKVRYTMSMIESKFAVMRKFWRRFPWQAKRPKKRQGRSLIVSGCLMWWENRVRKRGIHGGDPECASAAIGPSPTNFCKRQKIVETGRGCRKCSWRNPLQLSLSDMSWSKTTAQRDHFEPR